MRTTSNELRNDGFSVYIRRLVSALAPAGFLLFAIALTGCGTDSRAAAPSNTVGEIPVEAETVANTPYPSATSAPRGADVVVESKVIVPGSTSTPDPSIPPTKEPGESFTVHDLDVEPLVGTVYETLLSKMPDNEVTRAYTRMGDVAGVLEGLGIALQILGGNVENFVSVISGLETDRFYPPFWEWPTEARDYASIHEWFPDLAFDHGTAEQFAHTNSQFRFYGGNHPLASYDVALGPFSASATSAAVAACDCEQPEIREYSGVEYYAWGEGDGIGEIRERHKRPMFDHIGRGPHLLVLDGEAYYSVRDGVIDEHIDVIQGTKSSLADVEVYVSAVQWVSSLGLISEIVVRDFGFTVDQTLEGHYGQSSESEIVGGTPLLLPMELVATGVGYDGERMFTGLAIAHGDSATAEANVSRLLARLRGVVPSRGVSDGTQTWAYLVDRIEIQTSGRFLIARLYFTSSSTTRLMSISNNLFVYE